MTYGTSSGIIQRMRKIPAIVFAVLVMSGLTASFARAEVLSDDQKSHISSSCVSAKEAIRRLQTSDALLRVNRGQIYESLNTRLMLRFNTHAESKGYTTRSLVAVTDFYINALSDFRAIYQDYAKKLETSLATDCIKDQEKFLQSVLDARMAREKLHTSTQKINQTLGEYRSAFDAFVMTFNEKGGN